MRIIAGTYRSRTITMPKSAKVRPTKDRVREALFNIIGGAVNGARVLDVFAGSGAFGIEALSRGAERVIFIESDKICAEAIRKNLRDLAVPKEETAIIRTDAFKALDALDRGNKKFDIVLLDPPYYRDQAKKSLIKLDHNDIITPHCTVVVEHHKKDALPGELDTLVAYRTACYGDARLSFYRIKDKKRRQ